MKRIISFFAATLLLISLTGCGATKPEGTVEKFFAAAQKFDTAAMASTILPDNTQDIEDVKEFSQEQVPENQKVLYEYIEGYLKSNAAKMTYKVKGSEINGDSAVVTVDCKYVDGGPLFRAAIGSIMQKAITIALSGGEVTEAQSYQMLVDAMKEQSKVMSETYKETTVKINCIKKDNAWYISDVTDEMQDIITCGFISAAKDMGQVFGGSGSQ